MGKRENQHDERNSEPRSNRIKGPDLWVTDDEPMTGAQASYLETLSDEAGEGMDAKLTKAEASKKIDELQHKTGRGLDSSDESQEQRRDKNERQGLRGGADSV